MGRDTVASTPRLSPSEKTHLHSLTRHLRDSRPCPRPAPPILYSLLIRAGTRVPCAIAQPRRHKELSLLSGLPTRLHKVETRQQRHAQEKELIARFGSYLHSEETLLKSRNHLLLTNLHDLPPFQNLEETNKRALSTLSSTESW